MIIVLKNSVQIYYDFTTLLGLFLIPFLEDNHRHHHLLPHGPNPHYYLDDLNPSHPSHYHSLLHLNHSCHSHHLGITDY